MCIVTRHAQRRMKERVGLPKKAAQRSAERALNHGIGYADTYGSVRRYLEILYARGNADNIVIYGMHVYLFAGEALLTVMTVPQKLQPQVRSIKRRKRRLEDT